MTEDTRNNVILFYSLHFDKNWMERGIDVIFTMLIAGV